MPIDPNIALNIRPIQLPDPVEAYGRGLSLRNLVQQGQMGAEQLRAARMENQQHELDLQDQQTIRQAFGEHGGDLEKMTAAIAGRVAPKTLMALKSAALEQRAKLATIGKDELAVAQGHASAIADKAETLLNAPAEQRPALWQPAIADLVQRGVIKAEDAPAQYPGDEWVRVHANAKNVFDAEMKRREVAATEQNAQLSRDRFNAELPGIQSGNLLKGLQAAAQTVPNNQADWDTWRASLPADIKGKVPVMFSPAAAELVVGMGIAPAEKKQIEGAAETRTETARHNQASEDLTKRGQNLTDARSRESIDATRGNQTVNNEAKLRDDFKAATKDFPAIRDAYGRIQTAAQSAPSGASDIALLYGYMKLLDPNSAVREGEFATAANAGGIPDRISALYNRLLGGDKLSANVRAQMVQQAEQVYRRHTADNAAVTQQFRDIATRSGANPDNVIVDYGSTLRPAGEATGGAITVTDPTGGVHTFKSKAEAEAFKKLAGIK